MWTMIHQRGKNVLCTSIVSLHMLTYKETIVHNLPYVSQIRDMFQDAKCIDSCFEALLVRTECINEVPRHAAGSLGLAFLTSTSALLDFYIYSHYIM